MNNFADAVIAGTRKLGPLCVGIDPHPGRIPALFGGDTPEGVAAWGQAIVELAAGRVAAVKPQVGLFERLGPAGLESLQQIARAAKAAGLVVIMDAKRGDIGSTAEGYAQAYLGEHAPFVCDCVTVNPYMGLDTLEPFLVQAERHGRGIAVLARTSNPGAADFQALNQNGVPVWSRVAEALQPLSPRLQGQSGWSGLMLVAGATGPEEARGLREVAPRNLFLVPGYGAQGAGEYEALSGFAPGPVGLEGGLVNASRAVTFPPGAAAATTQNSWSDAVVAAIDAAQTALRAATT